MTPFAPVLSTSAGPRRRLLCCSALCGILTALALGGSPATAQVVDGTGAVAPGLVLTPGAIAQIATNGANGATFTNATTPAAHSTLTLGDSRTLIDWTGFSLGAGDSLNVEFQANSDILLNRLGAGVASIDGAINSSVAGATGGNVWFYSPEGVIFGSTAQVNVGGLLATTSPPNGTAFLAGTSTSQLAFGAAAATSYVTVSPNAQIATRGLLALVAPVLTTGAGANLASAEGDVLQGSVSAYTITLAESASDDLNLFAFEVPTGGGTDGPALALDAAVSSANAYVVAVNSRADVARSVIISGVVTATAASLGVGGDIILSSSGLAAAGDALVSTGPASLTNYSLLAAPSIGTGLRIDTGGAFVTSLPLSAGGAVSIDAETGVTLGKLTVGGDLDLSAREGVITTGAVTAQKDVRLVGQDFAGSILAGSFLGDLDIRDTAGGLTLTSLSAGGGISVRAIGGDLTVGSVTAEDGGVTLVADDALSATNVSATGDIVLNGAGVSLAGSSLTSASGSVSLTGPVTLAGDASITAADQALIGGTVDGGFDLVIDAGTAAITADVGATTELAKLEIGVGGALSVRSVAATGDVILEGAGVTLAGSNLASANGSVSLTGPVTLTGDASITAADQALLDGTIDGGFDLIVDADSTVITADIGAATKLAKLEIVGALDLQANIHAAEAVRIDGTTTLSGSSSIAAAAIELGGISGGHDLGLKGDTFAFSTPVDLGVGALSLTSTGSFDLATTITAAAINLVSETGSISQSTGLLTTDLFTATAAGDITLTGDNQIAGLGAISSQTGDLSLTSLSALATTGAATAPLGDIVIAADSILGDGTYLAQGDISLSSSAGDVSLATANAGGEISLVAVGGNVAAGSIDAGLGIEASGNAITVTGDIDAGGDLELTATTGDISIANASAGGDAKITAAGSIDLGAATAGLDLILSATALGSTGSLVAGREARLAATSADVTLDTLRAGDDVIIEAAGLVAADQIRTTGSGPDADLNGANIIIDAGSIALGTAAAEGDLVTRSAAGSIVIGEASAGDDIYVSATDGSARLGRVALTGLGLDLDHDGTGLLDGVGEIRRLLVTASGTGGDVLLGADPAAPLASGALTAPTGTEIRLTAARDVMVRAPDPLFLTEVTAGQDLLVETNGALSVVLAQAARDAVLKGASFDLGALTLGRDLTLEAVSGDLTIGAALTAPRNLTLIAAETLTTLAVTATAGDLTLSAGQVSVTGAATAAGDIAITALTGSVNIDSADAGQDLSLSAANGTLVIGSAAAARDVSLVAADYGAGFSAQAVRDLNVTATGGDLDIGALQAGRNLSLTAAGGVSGTSLSATAGQIAATAAWLDLASVTAGGDAMLVAETGPLSVTNLKAGGAAEASTENLVRLGTVEAGAAIVVNGADVQIDQASAGDDLTVEAASGDAAVGSAKAGDDIVIKAAGQAWLGSAHLTNTSSNHDAPTGGGLDRELSIRALNGTAGLGAPAGQAPLASHVFTAASPSTSGAHVVSDAGDVIVNLSSAAPLGQIAAGRDVQMQVTQGDLTVRALSAERNAVLDGARRVDIGTAEVAADISVVGEAGVRAGTLLAGQSIDLSSRSGGVEVDALTAGRFQESGQSGLTVSAGQGIDIRSLVVGADAILGAAGDVTVGHAEVGDDLLIASQGDVRLGSAKLRGDATDLDGDRPGLDLDVSGDGRRLAISGRNLILGGDPAGPPSGRIELSSSSKIELRADQSLNGNLEGDLAIALATAGGDLKIRATGTLAVDEVQAGPLWLEAASIQVKQATANGDIRLISSAGDVVADILNVGQSLSVTADGGSATLSDVRLSGAPQLASATGRRSLAVEARDDVLLTTTTPADIDYRLVAGRDLTATLSGSADLSELRAGRHGVIDLAGGDLRVEKGEVGGDLRLTASEGSVLTTTLTAGGDIFLDAAADIELATATLTGASVGSPDPRNRLEMRAGRDIRIASDASGGLVLAPGVDGDIGIQAGRDLTIDQAAGLILDAGTAGRNVSIRTKDTLTVNGLDAGGTITLASDADVSAFDIHAGETLGIDAGGLARLGRLGAAEIDISAADLELEGPLSASLARIFSASGDLRLGDGLVAGDGLSLTGAEFQHLAAGQVELHAGLAGDDAVRGDLQVGDLKIDAARVGRLSLLAGEGRTISLSGKLTPSPNGQVGLRIGGQDESLGWTPGSVRLSGTLGAADLTSGAPVGVIAFGAVEINATNDILIGPQRFITLIDQAPGPDETINISQQRPLGAAAIGDEIGKTLITADTLTLRTNGRLLQQNTAAENGAASGLFVTNAGQAASAVTLGGLRGRQSGPSVMDIFLTLGGGDGLVSGKIIASSPFIDVEASLQRRASQRINGCVIGGGGCIQLLANVITIPPLPIAGTLTLSAEDDDDDGEELTITGSGNEEIWR